MEESMKENVNSVMANCTADGKPAEKSSKYGTRRDAPEAHAQRYPWRSSERWGSSPDISP